MHNYRVLYMNTYRYLQVKIIYFQLVTDLRIIHYNAGPLSDWLIFASHLNVLKNQDRILNLSKTAH